MLLFSSWSGLYNKGMGSRLFPIITGLGMGCNFSHYRFSADRAAWTQQLKGTLERLLGL